MDNTHITRELIKVARMLALPEDQIDEYIYEEGDKWAIVASRSGFSSLGRAQAYAKDKRGRIMLFDTEAEAQKVATKYNKKTSSFNVSYGVEQYSRVRFY